MEGSKHIHTVVVAALVALVGIAANEAHKVRLEQQSTRDRVDVLIGVERDLLAAVNPKAQHLICKAKDDRPEIDLGLPHECPDGMCVTWKGQELNLQAAGARCDKGAL